MEVFFEEATASTNDRLKMIVTIPDGSYFSIGFGDSMFNVDMIGWHAKGANSYAKDYFSTGKYKPPADAEQNLETEDPVLIAKVDEDDYDKVRFVTYRDLETTDTSEDFIVPLDEEIEMIYGFHPSRSDWVEHKKRGYWKMKVHRGLGNPQPVINLDDSSSQEPMPAGDEATDQGQDVNLISVLFVGIISGLVVLVCIVGFICLCCAASRNSKGTVNRSQQLAVRADYGAGQADNRA